MMDGLGVPADIAQCELLEGAPRVVLVGPPGIV